MVLTPGQPGNTPEELKSPNVIQNNLNNLKEKIDALAEMPGKKVYEMAAKMSSKVWEMANQLPEGDPDREEALAAIAEMVDATFELKEADQVVNAPNDELITDVPEKLVG